MLARKFRIDRNLFKEILKKGKEFSAQGFSLKISPLSENYSRFAFVVPSEVTKKAVIRNKTKRRARHIVKKMLPKIEKGLGVIIFFKKGVEKMNFQELEEEIKEAFKKAKVIQ